MTGVCWYGIPVWWAAWCGFAGVVLAVECLWAMTRWTSWLIVTLVHLRTPGRGGRRAA